MDDKLTTKTAKFMFLKICMYMVLVTPLRSADIATCMHDRGVATVDINTLWEFCIQTHNEKRHIKKTGYMLVDQTNSKSFLYLCIGLLTT